MESLYKMMGGQVEALEFTAGPECRQLLDRPMKDLPLKQGVLVGAIARDKESYVANMQFLFVTTNAINLAMRTWRGLYGAEYLPITAVGAAFVVLGMVIGNALSRRMSGDMARQVVYIGVGVSGLVTLLQQIL